MNVQMKNSVKHPSAFYMGYLAIGGILGDIGTSPLYVMLLVFKFLPVSWDNVLGVLSLIIWSFIFLSLKYAWLALNLDNNGEGGTYALLNLILQAAKKYKGRLKSFLIGLAFILAMACGSLLLSDGVITPSISVLAAIEGIEVVYPHFQDIVIPLAVTILAGLFISQKYGTEKITKFFSPIMILWFLSIAWCGLLSLVHYPKLLLSINPYYAWQFILAHPVTVALSTLGYVVLCITGGEALYADEAHYSKAGIRLAWGFAALCLLSNYLGQAAYLLRTHDLDNPFFGLALQFGHGFYLYMLVLSTLAAIIASQAMITGAFSTYSQAMALRMFPRLEIINTSSKIKGQTYLPVVNKAMFLACLATVIIFRSSDRLGDAYGLAVTGAFIGTSLMMAIYFWMSYQGQFFKLTTFLSLIVFFSFFDLSFFLANLGKIPTGGWFPILISTILIFTMNAWRKGTKLLYQSIPFKSIEDFAHLIKRNNPCVVPGVDVYLSAREQVIPAAFLYQLESGVSKERVVLVSVKTNNHPWGISYEQKLLNQIQIKNKTVSIHQVIIERGYMRLFVNVPGILQELGLTEKEGSRFVFSLWNPIVKSDGINKLLLSYFVILYKLSPTLTNRFGINPKDVYYVGKDIVLA